MAHSLAHAVVAEVFAALDRHPNLVQRQRIWTTRTLLAGLLTLIAGRSSTSTAGMLRAMFGSRDSGDDWDDIPSRRGFCTVVELELPMPSGEKRVVPIRLIRRSFRRGHPCTALLLELTDGLLVAMLRDGIDNTRLPQLITKSSEYLVRLAQRRRPGRSFPRKRLSPTGRFRANG